MKIVDSVKLGLLDRSFKSGLCDIPTALIKTVSTKFPPTSNHGLTDDEGWEYATLPIEQVFDLESLNLLLNGSDVSLTDELANQIQNNYSALSSTELEDNVIALKQLYGELAANDTSSLIESPIEININRFGDLSIDGNDIRAAVIKLSSISSVPVRISNRHFEWEGFRREIIDAKLNKTKSGKQLYAPITHPDLDWIPTKHSHQRFEVISSTVEKVPETRTLLDIGCNLGYFCHRFEDLGFKCTGVEHDPELVYFLKKLKRASNRSFSIVDSSIFDFIGEDSPKYDVVLALAVFHWFLISETKYNQLLRLLGNLKMKEMYFVPHQPAEKQMQGAFWNPTEVEFVDFLLDKTSLSSAEYLGLVDANRSVYRLY